MSEDDERLRWFRLGVEVGRLSERAQPRLDVHVSQLDSTQLLRLSTWFKSRGEDMVDELTKTAGTLTQEQVAVAGERYRP